MAGTPTEITAAISGDVVPRRRGKSKAPNFKYEGPLSVIRLELDVSDERTRRRVERQWAAVFRLRRAVQRDAQQRCRAYWAARHERGADPKALRERLGLSRNGIEATAKSHIEASGWMRDHLTKAIGLHLADEIWQTLDRHLFADSSGRRHGPPRIGSWWDFTRIPGRARSHTKASPVWETYRLVGTLDGHLAAYRHPELPTAVTTASAAAARPARTSILDQPTRLATPVRPASGKWADHDGALAVVFTGLPGGDVVLPLGWPTARASGRTCVISWPTRRCGTRLTWCGCGTAKRPAAGAITRIYSYIRAGISPRLPGRVAPRSPPSGAPGSMPTHPTWQLPRFPTTIPSS